MEKNAVFIYKLFFISNQQQEQGMYFRYSYFLLN